MARPVRFNSSNRKPESEFKRAAMKWLKIRFGRRFFALHIAGGPYQRAGSPDVVCSIHGCWVGLEFKDPGGGGRIGPRQQEFIEDARAHGARCYIIQSWEDLEAAVAEFDPVQLGMEKRFGALPHD